MFWKEKKLFQLISHEGGVELHVPSACDLMDEEILPPSHSQKKLKVEKRVSILCNANEERDNPPV